MLRKERLAKAKNSKRPAETVDDYKKRMRLEAVEEIARAKVIEEKDEVVEENASQETEAVNKQKKNEKQNQRQRQRERTNKGKSYAALRTAPDPKQMLVEKMKSWANLLRAAGNLTAWLPQNIFINYLNTI